ncbi:MAG: hypothetical protein HY545_00205, partial [Candidatus Doudnabacteria bacterium]|nr:hypothetical protein [Candidatus Doudnabacteria bacterium]
MPDIDQNAIQKLFQMGQRSPADLERPVPQLGSVTQLADPALLAKFEALVKEIIKEDDGEVALLGVTVLKKLLKEYPQLKQESMKIYEKYFELISLLKLVNLSAQGGMPEIKELVANHLLDALQAGVNIQKEFDGVLDAYDDMLLEGQVAYELGQAMVSCVNRIGQHPLLIGRQKRQAPPTIGNWLIDYRSAVAADKGGSYEQITYMNQSENAR